ncbi:MAG: ABC transporter permease [Jaaginema sp. PMC 1079.18]|nr:ABC transporter permease [Jaaginema sp. PMC 1080.18]MEC4851331.1 ABC transporter permease [Jaaginema sp. PMC 1079.18]MEC4865856.1 ABC transporter permease [Jaaginema sp. PMC 1078.18]
MDFLETVKMAASTLRSNKLRSALTMLGIVIGNASVIAMVGIGQGTQRLAEEQFESLGPNTLFIVPGSREERETTFDMPKTLVWEDAKAIAAQVPSIEGVVPQINLSQVVTYRDRNANKIIVGTTPEFLTVRSFDVAKGRFINDLDLQRNNRIAVIGSDIADRFFPGNDAIGKRLRIKNISFEIVGVMEAKGSFLGNNQDEFVFVPLTTMSSQLRGRTSPYGLEISFISISAKDAKSVNAAKFQITNLLRLRHNITGADDFNIQTQKDILTIVGTVTSGLTTMLAAIAGISLLVGGIGVMNIMLVSVTERTQEIGLRKAIGAKQGDILAQFLIEAIILSALGGIFGTSLGIGGVYLVSAVSSLKAALSPVAIVLAVGVSGGIGLFFGVFPARRAARLDPIVALRTA